MTEAEQAIALAARIAPLFKVDWGTNDINGRGTHSFMYQWRSN